MSVEQITKIMYRCTCERKECPNHTKPWTTDTIPLRCPNCKSRRWNRVARLLPRQLTFNGETLTVAQWAKKLDLTRFAINYRIRQNWPIEQVLSAEDWRFQK